MENFSGVALIDDRPTNRHDLAGRSERPGHGAVIIDVAPSSARLGAKFGMSSLGNFSCSERRLRSVAMTLHDA